jgi:hypothetical protein
MNNSLYNIASELRMLLSSIADNDGEITPEQETALAITQQELESKGVNYALVIRECDASVTAIDAEIERLTKLKSKPQNLAKKLKENIGNAMKEFGVDKIESDLIKLSFRKSEETIIEDEKLLPESVFETKTVTTVSKTKVKELIKSGAIITGAYILEKKSLQIK